MAYALELRDLPATLLDLMGAHAPTPDANIADHIWLCPSALRELFDSMAVLIARDPEREWCRYAAYVVDDGAVVVFVWSRFGYLGFKVDADRWGWARPPS